jgi:antitoxin ParD1/3/4
MTGNAMSFSLPASLRAYIDERLRTGDFENTSQYLRDLVRRDQEDQGKRRLRALIAEGLESGPAQRFDRRAEAALRERALGTSW